MLDRRSLSVAPRALAAVLVALLLSAGLAAPASAAGPKDGPTYPKVTDLGPTSFIRPGPYGVGQTTLKLPSNDAPVEVWYPARKADVRGKRPVVYDVVDWLPDFLQSIIPEGQGVTYPSGGFRGVDVARGTFPLVVFSHGYSGFRDQSSFLTARLASWGFVVAAPDHHSRDLTKVLGGPAGTTTDIQDLRATVTLMTRRSEARTGTFANHVDTDLVGAVGHSAGGAAVMEWAAVDRRVTTYVGLAPGTPEGKLPRQPGLLMAGTSDGTIPPERIIASYDNLKRSKRLILMGGGHHAFSDLCEVGSAQGGLLEIAEMLNFPVSDQMKALASDGCEPPALDPKKAWPAVRQGTIAHLRHELGLDRTRKGLKGLKAAFPGVVTGNRSAR